jgi:Na+/melibiose symporter-like transporter
MTTFQTQIPQEALSRVGSYDAFGSRLFAPIGVFVAGPLAQWIGARDALLIAGSVVLIASISALLVRDVRNLESVVDQATNN